MPKKIDALVQWFGHAGRDLSIQAITILLVEKSYFSKVQVEQWAIKFGDSPMCLQTKQKRTDDVASPQKYHTLNDRGNTLNSRGVHEDVIGEAPKEDMSQENMALAPKYCHDTSLEMLVIPVMVMSSTQTNEDIDGKGEAGDAVDDVGGGRMRSWEVMVMLMEMW